MCREAGCFFKLLKHDPEWFRIQVLPDAAEGIALLLESLKDCRHGKAFRCKTVVDFVPVQRRRDECFFVLMKKARVR